MTLTPGSRLGVYDVTARIGEGGMGEVYRARDTKLNRDVALKVLPDSFAGDPDRLARFTREAQTLASLNHPSIAAIYGLEESPAEAGHDVRALVMELVEGEDLSQRIARGAIPVDEALPIAKQIADALEAAHEQGIIHRDLKPANIKVRPDGAVKVLDFGLAKAMEPAGTGAPSVSQSPTITTPAMTQAGIILGTAAYMSPEQAKGRPADKRSDIWAFGCVLYEMLAGRRAFDGEDMTDVLGAVVRLEPNWAALPFDVPQPVRTLLQSCLIKDRRQRVADISVALFVLDKAASLAPSASTVSVTPLPRRPLWRRALPLVAAVVVTVVVIGYPVWRPRPEPARPVTRFAVTLPPGESFSNLGGHVLALSPDGAHLVYAANLRLYLRARDQVEATPIQGTEGNAATSARRPFFSPDGQWIGFWHDAQLKKVAVAGGAPVTLGPVPVPPSGASWGTDDTIVFSGDGLSGIWRVPAAGGTPENMIKLDEGYRAHGPQVLPGGRHILFTLAKGTSWDEAQIVVHSLETGARQVLVNNGGDALYVSTGHLVYFLGRAILAVPFDLETLTVTGGPTPLVENVRRDPDSIAGQFTLASEGTLAYVPFNVAVAEAQRTLMWVDRQGREEPIPAPPGRYVYPRVSPDGSRLALDVTGQNRDLWVWDFSRGTLTRLTLDPTAEGAPVWTPDGRRLIFHSNPNGSANLFWQPADGTGAAERLTDSSSNQVATSISPDGALVVFRESSRVGIENLMVLTLAGARAVQPLLASPFEENNGEFSPDGRWLAYESTASGRDEIFVRPFPEVAGGQWQISTIGGSEPLWARDGRELFYRAPDGAVMRVAVESGSAWKAGTPTRLLQGGYFGGEINANSTSFAQRTYDISPDGRRFVMIKEGVMPAAAQTARFIVVENWFEELKRLVPTN